MHWLRTICLTALGLVFLLLGLIGMLLPFFPGLPLLVLALLCLGAASPMLSQRFARHPQLRPYWRRWEAGTGLPLLQRARLGLWLTLGAISDTLKRPGKRSPAR